MLTLEKFDEDVAAMEFGKEVVATAAGAGNVVIVGTCAAIGASISM
jgi:hypothetical protein